jgi:hypothetical protein
MENSRKINNNIPLKAIYDGRYLIITIVFLSVIGTAIFGYLTIAPYHVSALVKPGSYIGGDGSVKPVISPEAIEQVIVSGSFNALIEKSLTFRIKYPFEIKATLPKGADIIKVSFETKDPREGEIVIGALLTQLTNYYGREKSEKYDADSYKYLQGLKMQLSSQELNMLKAVSAKERLKGDMAKLLANHRQVRDGQESIEGKIKMLKNNNSVDDLLKLQTELASKNIELKEGDLAIRDKNAELAEKEKESAKLILEIAGIKKQIIMAEGVIRDGKGVEIIQSPMVVMTGFKEWMAKYLFTALFISLFAGMLLAFVVYDIKNKRDR